MPLRCGVLGVSVPEERVWAALLTAGGEALEEDPPLARPLLLGERHLPGERGSLTRLTPGSLGPAPLTQALYRCLSSHHLTSTIPWHHHQGPGH